MRTPVPLMERTYRILVILNTGASLTLTRKPDGEFQINAQGIVPIVALVITAVAWLIAGD